MTEKPILLNGDMVRAVLRRGKTQTRRIIKLPQAPNHLGEWRSTTIGGPGIVAADGRPTTTEVGIWHTVSGVTLTCPLGRPGDRLWVRETWRQGQACLHRGRRVFYAADFSDYDRAEKGPWTPSIHMPRWVCRLVLDITEVRVQRLQDITEDDALAEGIDELSWERGGYIYMATSIWPHAPAHSEAARWPDTRDPRKAFEWLWSSIYGAESWAANLWVWAISFQRNVAGDDEVMAAVDEIEQDPGIARLRELSKAEGLL